MAIKSGPGDVDLRQLENRLAPIFRNVNSEIDATSIFGDAMNIGKYELTRLLSCGGQAYVFLALDSELERSVVVKLYRRRITDDQKNKILREGRAMSKINNANVARCHTVDEFNGMPFLVMEHIDGQTLSEYAQHQHPTTIQSLKIIRQIADGLKEVHEAGFLHLDLKPSNIMIDKNGVPKLIDFGLAEPVGSPALDIGSGTPAFIAPERASCDIDSIGEHTDVFGIGGILYFLLAGLAPFAGRTKEAVRCAAQAGAIRPIAELNPRVTPDVQELCAMCLAKTPENRFRNVETFGRHVDAIVNAQNKRSRRQGFAAATIFLLIVGLLSALYLFPKATRKHQSAKLSEFIDQRVEDVMVRLATIYPADLKQDYRIMCQLRGADGKEFPKDNKGNYLIPDKAGFTIRLRTEQSCFIGVMALNKGERGNAIQVAEPIFPYDHSELSEAKFAAGQWRELPELVASRTGVVEYLYVAACGFPWQPKAFKNSDDASTNEKEEKELTRSVERSDKPYPQSELLIPFEVVDAKKVTERNTGN